MNLARGKCNIVTPEQYETLNKSYKCFSVLQFKHLHALSCHCTVLFTVLNIIYFSTENGTCLGPLHLKELSVGQILLCVVAYH